MKFVPGQGASVAREPVNRTNGLTRDLQGRLVACERMTRRITRREADGTITTINVPGSNLTNLNAINPAGQITGRYDDSQGLPHGFVRARNGNLTFFDVPGSIATQTTAMNSMGVITGYYEDATGSHGFLRTPQSISSACCCLP